MHVLLSSVHHLPVEERQKTLNDLWFARSCDGVCHLLWQRRPHGPLLSAEFSCAGGHEIGACNCERSLPAEMLTWQFLHEATA